jgi:hypothetical protein
LAREMGLALGFWVAAVARWRRVATIAAMRRWRRAAKQAQL